MYHSRAARREFPAHSFLFRQATLQVVLWADPGEEVMFMSELPVARESQTNGFSTATSRQ
jgi:hypothetical protein